MRKFSLWAGTIVLLAASAGTLEAQRFGAQVSWGSDTDIGVGARGEFDLSNTLAQQGPFSRAFIIAAFDYFFWDCGGGANVDCSYWELNPSLAVPLQVQNPSVTPYLGAGLNIARASVSSGGFTASNTETGLNLLGGLKFPLGGVSAYTEARVELGGGEQLVLSFGLLFGGKR